MIYKKFFKLGRVHNGKLLNHGHNFFWLLLLFVHIFADQAQGPQQDESWLVRFVPCGAVQHLKKKGSNRRLVGGGLLF